MKIHLIDDDLELHDVLKLYFEDFQIDLTCSELPSKGLAYIKENKIDLVIIDLMMPEMDGFEVCKKIREFDDELPIIMLTAKKDDISKILGLELGADDYLSKPFNPRELLARVKTILRRFEKTSNKQEKTKNILYSPTWDIELNYDSREVLKDGEVLDFTSTEFALLKCLMENAKIVQSRDALMDKVKGIDFESFDRSIDVYISKIRQKLKDDPKKGNIIKTVWGVGYIFPKL
ncbi:MAG: response regulator transcription factor [Candidatus Sericytochromatia bacterium]